MFALAVVTGAACLRIALNRYRDPDAEARAVPAARAHGGGRRAARRRLDRIGGRSRDTGQSIPSTWDAVWHANTIRFILDTGQASPTHMGELRNIETHDALYYPSTFHALASVFSQLTGSAPTTAYTSTHSRLRSGCSR